MMLKRVGIWLLADVLAEPQLFDFAIGGITITDARREIMLMSDGYLANGKTILCRTEDASRFCSLEDIDQPEVRVMVNPGGLNDVIRQMKADGSLQRLHEKYGLVYAY